MISFQACFIPKARVPHSTFLSQLSQHNLIRNLRNSFSENKETKSLSVTSVTRRLPGKPICIHITEPIPEFVHTGVLYVKNRLRRKVH